MADYSQPTRQGVSRLEFKSSGGEIKEIIDQTANLLQDLEKVHKDRKSLDFATEEIQPLVNNVADSLCLSVVVMLRGVLHVIAGNLRENLTELIDKHKQSGQPVVSGKGDMRQETTAPDDEAEKTTESELAVPAPIGVDRTTSEEFGAALNPSSFEVLESAPPGHRFGGKNFDLSLAPKNYIKAIRRELKLLESALPPGIFVKSYEDRMDLFSCMIVGPQGTPYADGLFFFDIRLKEDYPTRPPHVFFKSLSKRLNPNLYEDGMVCLSLLGTWDGKSIQKVLAKPHEPFEAEIRQHFKETKTKLTSLLDRYQGLGEDLPYPLRPVTQGFCLCIRRHTEKIKILLENLCADD